MNRLFFKRFRSSANKLPREYGHYRNKDRTGHGAAFYAELIRAKKIYRNPAQSLTNVKEFETFKEQLLCKIREFENKWSKRYKKYTNEYIDYE